VLVVAGPNSRALMEAVSDADFSNAAFPWLSGKTIDVGMAQVRCVRVNFVGELGWEIHHDLEYQNHIFDTLMTAGDPLGLKPFGIRAMDSLRLEKSYRLVGTEMSIEYAALETGLDRFVRLDKGDFVGRDALLAWQKRGFDNQFVSFKVNDITDADALGNEPIFLNGELVGRATAGGYGWRLGVSLGLGYVRPDVAAVGTKLEIDILGKVHTIEIIPESPFDTENLRIRA